MDSTSPIAQRIAGQPSLASGSFFKPNFGMAFLTLVENLFVGRRWQIDGNGCDADLGLGLGLDLGRTSTPDSARRRYRERYSHLAEGHGHAS